MSDMSWKKGDRCHFEKVRGDKPVPAEVVSGPFLLGGHTWVCHLYLPDEDRKVYSACCDHMTPRMERVVES